MASEVKGARLRDWALNLWDVKLSQMECQNWDKLEDAQLLSAAELIAYLLLGRNPCIFWNHRGLLCWWLWCESRGKTIVPMLSVMFSKITFKVSELLPYRNLIAIQPWHYDSTLGVGRNWAWATEGASNPGDGKCLGCGLLIRIHQWGTAVPSRRLEHQTHARRRSGLTEVDLLLHLMRPRSNTH